MKKIVSFIVLSIIMNLHLSAQNYTQMYEESILTWETLKIKNGNSYSYKTTYSGMAGRTDTQVFVESGIVVKKIFHYFGHTDNFTSTTFQNPEDLKTTKTMDEIYQFTLEEVLVKIGKQEEYQLYFELNDDKLIRETGYYPFGCKDDCFEGYTIVEITWE